MDRTVAIGETSGSFETENAGPRCSQGVLDELSQLACCLDPEGTLVSVNRSWVQAAQARGLHAPAWGVGANYLRVCRQADPEEDQAGLVADGLLGVLRGERSFFGCTYPCHAPDLEQWYEMQVTPLGRDSGAAALVQHHDVTPRRQHERHQILSTEIAERWAAGSGRPERAEALSLIAEVAEWPFVFEWAVQGDMTLRLVHPQLGLPTHEFVQASSTLRSEGVAADVAVRGRARWVPRVGASERDALRGLLRYPQPQAAFAVPQYVSGHFAGVTVFYASRTARPDTRFLQLCERVLRDLPPLSAPSPSRKALEPGWARSQATSKGASPAGKSLLDRAAGSEATVLLLGESGTGKTRLARQIHERSCRTGRPFLDLNCAGLGASLLESELFGYEKGAFTGANARKQGLLELAAGGTVLLDEIGELDLAVQAKLLKVLESRKFRRLGGGAELSVDVRFIGATNRNLRKAISEGRFREDLYYRLNVIEIPVPALRERTNELPELAARLLTELSEKEGRRPPRLTPDAERRLMRHSWPGNIRELRNVLERALLGAGATISGQELRDAMPAVPDPSPAPDRASDGLGSLAEREREHLIRVLAETGFNVRRSAKILGIARSTLYERLRKHELDLKELRRTARQRVRARPDSR